MTSLAVSAALSTNLYAQEAEVSEDDVEKIMVTARKRTESLYETPTAISSIGSE